VLSFTHDPLEIAATQIIESRDIAGYCSSEAAPGWFCRRRMFTTTAARTEIGNGDSEERSRCWTTGSVVDDGVPVGHAGMTRSERQLVLPAGSTVFSRLFIDTLRTISRTPQESPLGLELPFRARQ